MLQFTAVYFWATHYGPLNLQAVPPERWALAAVLFAAGQASPNSQTAAREVGAELPLTRRLATRAGAERGHL